MDTRIKLSVQGLANSQIQSGAYALILKEDEGSRRIPIIIGTSEAQSIAVALQHIITPRPLTHDLFTTFSQAVGVVLKEIFIYKFEDGVYYSEMLFFKGEEEIKIDSRTSDAIAIALRLGCSIYTTPEIMDECGVELHGDSDKDDDEKEESDLDSIMDFEEPEEIQDEEMLKQWLALMDDAELSRRLSEAIQREKYENAQLYKNEIERRQEEGAK